MEINASTTVGSLLRDYPELTDWFMELGLCGCGNDSSMMWTIERVANEKNKELSLLLDSLRKKTS